MITLTMITLSGLHCIIIIIIIIIIQQPILFEGATKPPQKVVERLEEVLNWVQEFLAPTGFVAGTQYMTLADIRYRFCAKLVRLYHKKRIYFLLKRSSFFRFDIRVNGLKVTQFVSILLVIPIQNPVVIFHNLNRIYNSLNKKNSS